MKTITILAAALPVLLSTTAFALTTSDEATEKTAAASGQAEMLVVADCGVPAFHVAAEVSSWQDALAAKRRHDQVVTLAKAEAGAVSDCMTAGQ